MRLLGQESQQASQWDAEPIRPVGQLILDLVEGFLKQEKVEQAVGRPGVGGPQPLPGHGLAIGRQHSIRGLVAPFGQSEAQPAALVGRDLEGPFQRGGRSIVDRADQAGDVARRRCLAAPLGDGAARSAVEIDDEDVVLDDQQLAEMQIAMMADAEPVGLAR